MKRVTISLHSGSFTARIDPFLPLPPLRYTHTVPLDFDPYWLGIVPLFALFSISLTMKFPYYGFAIFVACKNEISFHSCLRPNTLDALARDRNAGMIDIFRPSVISVIIVTCPECARSKISNCTIRGESGQVSDRSVLSTFDDIARGGHQGCLLALVRGHVVIRWISTRL